MIRKAVAADRASAVSMARSFHAASDLPFPFSAAAASMLFDASIVEPDRACFVIDDGSLQGILSAMAYRHPLGNCLTACETFWWVHPRCWRQLPDLLSAYEAWAVSRGCVFVGMGMIGGARAQRAFERVGYSRVEQMFAKHL